jgi:hypothetical protein
LIFNENIEQGIAEPDRENYAVLRKVQVRLESMKASRLAQDVMCDTMSHFYM